MLTQPLSVPPLHMHKYILAHSREDWQLLYLAVLSEKAFLKIHLLNFGGARFFDAILNVTRFVKG